MTPLTHARQRGAALVVGLIMLLLITIMLITALNLGSANFRSVSNMQYREEAISAANRAIDAVIGSNFYVSPVAQDIGMCRDNNPDCNPVTDPDYIVHIERPQCIYAALAEEYDPSSESVSPALSLASTWNTVWDIRARVEADENPGGAGVVLRAGVRALLTQAQRDAECD